MTARTLQRVDYYVGGPLLALTKPWVWALGRLLRRDHTLTPRGEIGFVKLLGGGSLVIAFPALLGLRLRYPDCRLSIVTTRRTQPFAASLGIFDTLHVMDDRSWLRLGRSALACLARTFGVDTLVDLEVYSRFSTLFSALSAARNRLGFYLETTVWRRRLHTHLVFFNRFGGTWVVYDALARWLGAEPAPVAVCRRWLRDRYGWGSGRPGRRVAVGHGCSDLGRERALDETQWLAVAERRLGPGEAAEVVLLGGVEDRELGDRIARGLRARRPALQVLNRAGALPLEDSLRVLADATEFWGVDSALLHYARLLGVPTVSFWGPTDPRVQLRPVPGLAEEVHYEKIACSPCLHVAEVPPCRGRNLCIQGLFEPLEHRDTIAWML